MPIVVVSKDQDISDLVNQLYRLPRRGADRVAQAVQALLEANPHLEGSTRIAAGTPIVVPHVPDLTPRATPRALPTGTLDQLGAQTQQGLAYARSVIDQAASTAQEDAKNSLEVLRSREFRAVAGPANVDVEALTAAVNKANEEAQAQAKTDLAGLDALTRAVEEFVKTLGATPPATDS